MQKTSSLSSSTSKMLKTHHCGHIDQQLVGQDVTVCGWINKTRNLGGILFCDLRDKYGLLQLNFTSYQDQQGLLKELSLESVVQCRGKVVARPPEAVNSQMRTGEVEVMVEEVKILAVAATVPFLPQGQIEATEDLRLRYRYLDLRSQGLQNILTLRSQTMRTVRETLYRYDFTEVETPILYKTTPEGARDYIVPSRVHPGKVYALPQSPQTLKQLLMIGNVDRYFQICRCFRDEDLRADRQPEFTQVDIEVSFATADYMKFLAEEILKEVFKLEKEFSLPVMSYKQAMEDYGSDKPDLRYGLKHHLVTDRFRDNTFQTFKSVSEQGGMIKMIYLPLEQGALTRKQIDELTLVVKPYGGKGVAWLKWDGNQWSGSLAKFVTTSLTEYLWDVAKKQGSNQGTYLFVADLESKVVHDCADALRRCLAKEFKLYDEDDYSFLWITEFPLLEYDAELNRFFACHHPFTAPMEEDKEKFYSGKTDQLKTVRAEAYDLVCNGYELAGGSMRIYDSKDQTQMFQVLGLQDEEVKNKFGFFLEALKYGTPPHGGMAWGLDRLIMILAKTDNLRDVIAFPKTTTATDLMAQAPSTPSVEQLRELKMSFDS